MTGRDVNTALDRLEEALDSGEVPILRKHNRDAIEALATVRAELQRLQSLAAKNWDEQVAEDKARAIRAEIHAEAAEARVRELEARNESLATGGFAQSAYDAACSRADEAEARVRALQDGLREINGILAFDKDLDKALDKIRALLADSQEDKT